MNKKLVSLITMTAIMFTSVSPVFAKNFTSKQNVALNHPWTVNFNQKVNVNETFEGVYIEDSKGSKIPTKIDFSDDHTKMIITPADGYKPNTTYTLNVEGVSNEQGKALSDKAEMQFATVDTAQAGNFDITSITANNGQGTAKTNLDPNSSFSFQLSKNVDASTLSNITVTDKDGNKANVKSEAVGNTITINANNAFQDDTKTITVPRNAFKCNTTYTINLSGVKSTDGQDIATNTYTFKTRAYKLNPTISGICNDDYISFGNQYASDMYQIPDGDGDGYFAQSLQKCHDNNGTLVLDPYYNSPVQITNDWNKYANLQNRNMVNLQVEIRKEYQKIAAKNSSYAGYNVGFRESAPQTTYGDTTGKVTYEYMTNILDSMPSYSFRLFSLYKYNLPSSLVSGIVADGTTTDLNNAFKSNNPQLALEMSSTSTDAKGNLSRLALYQSLYCMFGGDYAGEIYDYIIQEEGLNYDQCQKMYTKQLGNITIYDNNGVFLFKY